MRDVPGTLHSGGAPFQQTHWSVVHEAAQAESPEAAERALTSFCQAYWPPLYGFLRRRGHRPADAQDLTQAFFAHLLEQNTLSRAAPEKGRLRTFLLGSLQHFLANEHDRATAQKRGGDRQIVSIEDHLVEAEAAVLIGAEQDESCWYDQTWAATLVSRAWERLQAAFASEGKAEWLSELKPFVVGGTPEPPSQEQVAARLNVPLSTLRTWLQRLRQRYRETLRAEVARTVPNSADIDDELHYLYRVLMS
jgi:RNA polymerase sigma-70 factor (ECF subfamily)